MAVVVVEAASPRVATNPARGIRREILRLASEICTSNPRRPPRVVWRNHHHYRSNSSHRHRSSSRAFVPDGRTLHPRPARRRPRMTRECWRGPVAHNLHRRLNRCRSNCPTPRWLSNSNRRSNNSSSRCSSVSRLIRKTCRHLRRCRPRWRRPGEGEDDDDEDDDGCLTTTTITTKTTARMTTTTMTTLI